MSRTITVIPGDGIGPGIIKSAVEILDKPGYNFSYEYDAILSRLS